MTSDMTTIVGVNYLQNYSHRRDHSSFARVRVYIGFKSVSSIAYPFININSKYEQLALKEVSQTLHKEFDTDWVGAKVERNRDDKNKKFWNHQQQNQSNSDRNNSQTHHKYLKIT